jgi:hypothetical protein
MLELPRFQESRTGVSLPFPEKAVHMADSLAARAVPSMRGGALLTMKAKECSECEHLLRLHRIALRHHANSMEELLIALQARNTDRIREAERTMRRTEAVVIMCGRTLSTHESVHN